MSALSKIDEFLLNPQIRTHSGTVPGTFRNTNVENQVTNEDDSQSDPHPEAGIFRSQTTQNSGPEVGHDMVTRVQKESLCVHDRCTFYQVSARRGEIQLTYSTKGSFAMIFHFMYVFSWVRKTLNGRDNTIFLMLTIIVNKNQSLELQFNESYESHMRRTLPPKASTFFCWIFLFSFTKKKELSLLPFKIEICHSAITALRYYLWWVHCFFHILFWFSIFPIDFNCEIFNWDCNPLEFKENETKYQMRNKKKTIKEQYKDRICKRKCEQYSLHSERYQIRNSIWFETEIYVQCIKMILMPCIYTVKLARAKLPAKAAGKLIRR